MHSIYEDHQIHAVERPVLPFDHHLNDLIGDPRDRFFRHRRVINLCEMGTDFTGRQSFRCQRQHDVVHPSQTALAFAHDHRSERAVPVTGHIDADWADIGDHRFRSHPVTRIFAVPADRVVGVIAKMLRHLGLESGLQNLFRETTKQTARTNQIHPLRPGPVHELPRELLVQNRPPSKLIHDLSLPARWHPPSLIGLLHRYRPRFARQGRPPESHSVAGGVDRRGGEEGEGRKVGEDDAMGWADASDGRKHQKD